MKFDVAHLSLPMTGQIANGDRAVFRTDGDGRYVFAVIDGLGHGVDAAAASEAGAAYLDTASLELPLADMMEQLHLRMAGSRGAAATVCVLRGREIEACAVGNVEVRSADLRLPLLFSAGILGVRVAKFRICRAAITRRARMVLFSDGISSSALIEEVRNLSPREACDAIMKRYRREKDDATVLVADAD
jgi:hypothetical protein